jgi:thiol-disulfide isomerase/thioredoxin
MRATVAMLLLAFLAAPAATAAVDAGSGVDRCFERKDPGEKLSCVEEAWGRSPVDLARIQTLEQQLDRDPSAVVSIGEWLERAGLAPTVDRAGELLARWQEVQGRALTRIARYDRAVERFRSALALDDGTNKLFWMDRRQGGLRADRLDAGSGRIVRAARAELLAGNMHQARALFSTALSLGSRGWAEEGWKLAGGGALPDGGSPHAGPLTAPRWFEPLPAIDIPLIDGSVFSTAGQDGRVVLIDFWASWCAPCLEELPHLQKLYNESRERGLAAVAVNAQEPKRVALETAESLGLSVPIGMYDESVDRAFMVRNIPTVIIADRQGRIRARWNGYASGLEQAVAAMVEVLLGDDPEGAPEPVAELLAGEGRLIGKWKRELPAPVTGIAVVESEDGSSRIAAATLGGLVVLADDGRILGQIELPGGAGRLTQGDVDADGRTELLGFRAGRASVVVVEVDSGDSWTWQAPASLMDLDFVPSWGDGKTPRLAAATVNGLYLADLRQGSVPTALDRGFVRAVRSYGGAGSSGLVYLSEGRIRWLDSEGKTRTEHALPAESWRIVAVPRDADRAGVLPPDTAAAIEGSFTSPAARQVAVAMASGQLVVLSSEEPSTAFRADWPAIRELAAADLDGDGLDELIVASGRSLTVLGVRAEGRPGLEGAIKKPHNLHD